MTMVPLKSLQLREPFLGLFPRVSATVDALVRDMKGPTGFNPAHPMIVWKRRGVLVLIDGHLRYEAAMKAGIKTVPIHLMTFADEHAALQWMFAEQAERRRNLTKAQANVFLLKAIKAMDSLQGRGGDRKSTGAKKSKGARAPFDSERSATRTARTVGTSPDTVKRVRAIAQHGDAETKRAVEEGTMSIKEGARRARARKKKEGKTTKPTKRTKRTKTKAPATPLTLTLEAVYVASGGGQETRQYQQIAGQLRTLYHEKCASFKWHERFPQFLHALANDLLAQPQVGDLDHGFQLVIDPTPTET